MKKTLLLTFAFAGLLAFTACNDSADEARQKAIADSLRNDSIMKAEAAANANNSDAGSTTMESHDAGTSHSGSGSTGSSGNTGSGSTTTTDNSGTGTTDPTGGKEGIKNGEGTTGGGKEEIKNGEGTTTGGKGQIKGK